ncbi:Indoleamine 2,3-dioxygenase [Mucidula mucida]|nr:Indoleamine 2,3-dioxygenase [Mucidula mucida]
MSTPILPAEHFLSQGRLDVLVSHGGAVDTTTLAAHDFDVDNRTGFMPPHAPPVRLPQQWDVWERVLEKAQVDRIQLGSTPDLRDEEKVVSETWRESVRTLAVLSVDDLTKSEIVLRRAHHVLAWIMHFYIHSLPPDAPIVIPRSLTIPLLQVSHHLQLPPVLTYSDDVLYNWELPSSQSFPTIENLKCQTTFTGTRDEEEFYLTSSRMELRGVEALELMRETMDEAFVGDEIAVRRITEYLHRMATVIDELKELLMRVRDGCDPNVFYDQVRPWFKGVDSSPDGKKWEFEGLDDEELVSQGILYPTELSGPSAGQSALVHALDIFLGVSQYSHASSITGSEEKKKSFLERMQVYMPRHHRNFLNHLSNNPRPLREMVKMHGDAKLLEGYNAAVGALKAFRDSHIIIVTTYIIIPAKKGKTEVGRADAAEAPLKGTGGTDLAKFLKDVRNSTRDALLP